MILHKDGATAGEGSEADFGGYSYSSECTKLCKFQAKILVKQICSKLSNPWTQWGYFCPQKCPSLRIHGDAHCLYI